MGIDVKSTDQERLTALLDDFGIEHESTEGRVRVGAGRKVHQFPDWETHSITFLFEDGKFRLARIEGPRG